MSSNSGNSSSDRGASLSHSLSRMNSADDLPERDVIEDILLTVSDMPESPGSPGFKELQKAVNTIYGPGLPKMDDAQQEQLKNQLHNIRDAYKTLEKVMKVKVENGEEITYVKQAINRLMGLLVIGSHAIPASFLLDKAFILFKPILPTLTAAGSMHMVGDTVRWMTSMGSTLVPPAMAALSPAWFAASENIPTIGAVVVAVVGALKFSEFFYKANRVRVALNNATGVMVGLSEETRKEQNILDLKEIIQVNKNLQHLQQEEDDTKVASLTVLLDLLEYRTRPGFNSLKIDKQRSINNSIKVAKDVIQGAPSGVWDPFDWADEKVEMLGKMVSSTVDDTANYILSLEELGKLKRVGTTDERIIIYAKMEGHLNNIKLTLSKITPGFPESVLIYSALKKLGTKGHELMKSQLQFGIDVLHGQKVITNKLNNEKRLLERMNVRKIKPVKPPITDRSGRYAVRVKRDGPRLRSASPPRRTGASKISPRKKKKKKKKKTEKKDKRKKQSTRNKKNKRKTKRMRR